MNRKAQQAGHHNQQGNSKEQQNGAPAATISAASTNTSSVQFKVTAAPFVPGASSSSQAATSSLDTTAVGKGNNKGGTTSLTTNAQPFVPASQKQQTAATSTTATAASGSQWPSTGQGRGGAGSPRLAGNKANANSNAAATASTPAGASQTVSTPTASSSTSGTTFTTGAASGGAHHYSTGSGFGHAGSPMAPGRGPGGRSGSRGSSDYTATTTTATASGGRGRGRASSAMSANPYASITDPGLATNPYTVSTGYGMSSSPGTMLPHTHGHMMTSSPGGASYGSGTYRSSGTTGSAGSPLVTGHRIGPGGRPYHGSQHAKTYPPGKAPVSKQFAEEGLRQQLAAAAYAVQAQWHDPSGTAALPDRLGMYHTLYPLDMPPPPTGNMIAASNLEVFGDSHSAALGVRTLLLKGVSSHDGRAYALRRIDSKQIPCGPELQSYASRSVDKWQGLSNHPHLVALRGAFTSSELDPTAGPALIMIYDFHPGCSSLQATHLSLGIGAGGCMSVTPPTEHQVWAYLVQLTSLLMAVHGSGLAVRANSLHPSKVIISPTGRVRVNCCGLIDAVSGDHSLLNASQQDMAAAQRADLAALGQLFLSLCCAGLVPPGHAGSLDLLSSPAAGGRYSQDFLRIIAALLTATEGGPLTSVRQLAAHPAILDRTWQQMDTASSQVDNLMGELSKECENGRLMRLLVKLCFVVERPEADMVGSWAETGDRYLLKLFRDYIFHQVVPEGSPGAGGPLLDWGHVVEALNKLDAGVSERVMLLSRDESAMLIASYGDLKRCVETQYQELKTKAAQAIGKSGGASGMHLG